MTITNGYLFRLRPQQMTTSQRTTATWDGGDAGKIPKGVLIEDSDLCQLYIGDGTPENGPTTGTVGGLLVGPELGGGFKTITSTATGTQDDFNPTDFNVCDQLLLNPASALSITGFLAPASWTPAPFRQDGQTKIITNISTTITPNILASPTSSAANNEILMSGTVSLPPHTSIVIRYDLANTKWRVVGFTKATKHYHASQADGGRIYQTFDHQARNATTLTTIKFFTLCDITIVNCKSTRRGGTSTTWNLRFGTDPTATGTKVWNTDVVTSTSGAVQTDTPNGGSDDPTIPAGNFIWMDVVSAVGPPTETFWQFEYTQDFV